MSIINRRSSIRFFSVGQKNFLRQRRCCAILLKRFVLGRGRRYAERCPSWPKEHDWKSCMPQKGIWGSNPHLSARLIPRASSRLALIWRPFAGASPLRRGGRVVECGGLENRFTGNPGDEGSNPSSSARNLKALASARAFSFSGVVVLLCLAEFLDRTRLQSPFKAIP